MEDGSDSKQKHRKTKTKERCHTNVNEREGGRKLGREEGREGRR